MSPVMQAILQLEGFATSNNIKNENDCSLNTLLIGLGELQSET